jgi:hypothetical protein
MQHLLASFRKIASHASDQHIRIAAARQAPSQAMFITFMGSLLETGNSFISRFICLGLALLDFLNAPFK